MQVTRSYTLVFVGLLDLLFLVAPLSTAAGNLNVKKAVSVVGNVTVTANLTKGSGTFLIDHPLDPEGQLLYHSFVESPDVLNMYDGIVTLDTKGEAIVRLPDYYDALNYDTQYLLRSIDVSAPNLYVKEKEHDNRFVVAGGVPGSEVSWQVTGIRHDPYILANPIVPEVEKSPEEIADKGRYLFPEGYSDTSVFSPLPGFFFGWW